MPIELGDAIWLIKSDDSPLRKGLGEAEGAVKGAMDGILAHSAKIGTAMTAIGASIEGIFAITLAQFSQQQDAEAQLTAALTSTAEAAGLAFDELKEMAQGLSEVSTYSDEAIISAQSLLLTFTNIKDDVFPGAMKAALDLSTRMGGDLNGAIMQVGKALNDPIKGIGALSDVGVSFSDAQKGMIEELLGTSRSLEKLRDVAEKADSGLGSLTERLNVAKVKLQEMRQNDAPYSAILRQTYEVQGLEEEIQKSLQTINAYKEAQIENAKVVDTASGMMRAQKIILNELGVEVGGSAAAAAATFTGQLAQMKNAFGNIMEIIGSALVPVLSEMMVAVKPIVESFAEWLKANPELTKTLVTAAAAIGAVMTVLGPLLIVLPGIVTLFTVLGPVIAGLAAPIAIAIGAIAALAAAGAAIWYYWDEISAGLASAWEFIQTAAETVWDAIVAYFQSRVEIFKSVLGTLRDAFFFVWDGIAAAFQWVYQMFTRIWDGIIGVFEWAGNMISSFWDWIMGMVQSGINGLISAVDAVLSAFGGGIDWRVDLSGGDLPGRASGGPVAAGMPYMVGERGAELFVPESNGTIVPNGALAGIGGTNIAINFAEVHVREEADIGKISREMARRLIAIQRL